VSAFRGIDWPLPGSHFGTIDARFWPIFAGSPSQNPPFTAIFGKSIENVGLTVKTDPLRPVNNDRNREA